MGGDGVFRVMRLRLPAVCGRLRGRRRLGRTLGSALVGGCGDGAAWVGTGALVAPGAWSLVPPWA